jgi:hypothetical protein
MIISSEIENVEKSGKFGEKVGKCQKSILRAFARTRAKKVFTKKVNGIRICFLTNFGHF